MQELVSCFVEEDAEDPVEKYANVATVIGQVRDALTYQKSGEREKIRLAELTQRNLQILRAILHNEIVKIPDENSASNK